MRCPHCSNKLLQKSGSETRLRIEGVVSFDEQGVGRAKCFWCKSQVTIPVELKKAAEDEERFTIPERHVVRPKTVA